jgi:DNA-binding MarR family transcriptional regulator
MNPVHLQIQLRIVQARLALAVHEAVKAAGITPNMHAMLDAISRYPGIRPGALADILVTGKPNVSRTLKALEQKGLLDRRMVSEDRRAVGLYVNHMADRLMLEIEARSSAADSNCLSILDEAEAELFCNVLGRLSADYFNLGST